MRSLRILAAAAAAVTATGAALTGPVGAASPASVAARLRAAGLRPVALLPSPPPSLLRHSKATLDEITGDGYSVSYLIPADISFLYACRIQGFTYRFLSRYYGGATKGTLRELIRGLRPV